LNLSLAWQWYENWYFGITLSYKSKEKHALFISEIHLAVAKSLEITGRVTNNFQVVATILMTVVPLFQIQGLGFYLRDKITIPNICNDFALLILESLNQIVC